MLQRRYAKHLDELLELAEKETHRTLWEKAYHQLACLYRDRLTEIEVFTTIVEGIS